MIREEGLPNIFRRHERHGKQSVRRFWSGVGNRLRRTSRVLDTVTAVFTPEGHDADQLRATILEHFDLSLGAGLGETRWQSFPASASKDTSTI